MTTTDAAGRFHALHREGQPLLLPNAWDYASAAVLVDAGFAAVGTTSLGVAAAHGLPDGQGRTRAETLALAQSLAKLPCLLTVDIEAGFSADPATVAQLAVDLFEAGAVGINVEDGQPGGGLAPVDRQQELISAIKSQVPRIFINARTDTHWLASGEPPLADTLARVDAYRVAGADGIFVPGLADEESIRAVVAAVDAPVNVLYLPGRHSVRHLADLGVRRISSGSLLFRTAMRAVVDAALALARDEPVSGAIPSYTETNDLVSRLAR